MTGAPMRATMMTRPSTLDIRIQTLYLHAVAGAHTRAIMVTTPSTAAGGIMRFAKKKLACLGCKAPIAAGSVCAHCAEKVRFVVIETSKRYSSSHAFEQN